MTMQKPICEYRFHLVDGLWRDVKGEGAILADVLSLYDIIIDDRCKFARIYDYDRAICFWYRVDGGLITLTLWQIYND